MNIYPKEQENYNQFMLEGAKRELAYLDYLVEDFNERGYSYEIIKQCLEQKGYEINTTTEDENDYGKQVDILCAYCGFTLQQVEGGRCEIGYCWVFNDPYNELFINKKGQVEVWGYLDEKEI